MHPQPHRTCVGTSREQLGGLIRHPEPRSSLPGARTMAARKQHGGSPWKCDRRIALAKITQDSQGMKISKILREFCGLSHLEHVQVA